MKFLIFFLITLFISILCDKDVSFNFNFTNESNLIFTNITINNSFYKFLVDTSTDYLILLNNNQLKNNETNSNLYKEYNLNTIVNDKYKILIDKNDLIFSNVIIAGIKLTNFAYFIGKATTYTEEIKLLGIEGIIGFGVGKENFSLIEQFKTKKLISKKYFYIKCEKDKYIDSIYKGILKFNEKEYFSKSSSVNFNINKKLKYETISKSMDLDNIKITNDTYLIIDTSLDKFILPEYCFLRFFEDKLINNENFNCLFYYETENNNYTIRCKNIDIYKFPYNLKIELNEHYLKFPYENLFKTIKDNNNNLYLKNDNFCEKNFKQKECFELNIMTYKDCSEIRLGQSFLKNFDINFLLDDKIEIFSKDYVIIFLSTKIKIFLHLLVIALINILFLSIIYIILNKLNYLNRIKTIEDDILRINSIASIAVNIDNNSNDSFIQLVKNNNNNKDNNNNDSIDNNNIESNSYVSNNL